MYATTTVRAHTRRLRARRTIHGVQGKSELDALTYQVRAAIHYAGGIANLGRVIEAVKAGIAHAREDEAEYAAEEAARLTA